MIWLRITSAAYARSPAKAGAQGGARTGPRLSPGNKWRIALLLLVLGWSLPAHADSLLPAARWANVQLPDPVMERRAKALMETIRCVVCQSESIADSPSEMAGDMRSMIRERVAAGEAPESIRAWLIARYGEWVSFAPSFEPVTWLLWAMPFLLVGGGLWLARGRFRRPRKR
jgi:cytochrome c-type biogenesis protein CcmH